MRFLRQNTTTQIMFGPVLMTSDGYSPSTALSLSTAVLLSKSGSTFVSRSSTATVTARKGGFYSMPLSTADTNTLGRLKITLEENSSHLPIWEDFTIVSVDGYKSLSQSVLNTTLEGGYTVKDSQRIMFAILSGLTTGAGSTILKFFGVNSTDIIRLQVEAGSSGNRKSVVLKSSS